MPPPPAQTEAEHRTALADAIEAQKRADAALIMTTDAHARALRLVEERRHALQAFTSHSYGP